MVMDGYFYKPRSVPHFDQWRGFQFITYCSQDKKELLNRDPIASLIIEPWNHGDGQKYDLLSWVTMPDHVHVLICIFSGQNIGRIVQTRKSFSAKLINVQLGKSGSFWQKDYWDTAISDDTHLMRVLEYKKYNPIKAGLVPSDGTYPWFGLKDSKLGYLL